MSEAQAQLYQAKKISVISNSSGKPCRFLLIQGVGKYDFVKEE